MAMTVNKLHKFLGEQIAAGHGCRKVCIDKDTYHHNLEEDGCTVMAVETASAMWVAEADGDGFAATNKDGSEKGSSVVVLCGPS